MSFLLGAYGKLMAGKRVRQLQARMMSVQSQLRRATRDIQNMEKYFNAQEKNMKNQMSLFSSNTLLGMQQGQLASVFNQFGITGMDQVASLDKDKQASFYSYMQGMSTYNTQANQNMQYTMQMMNSMMENQFEMQKEMQLQPLKDLEEDLQLEKDSLESQIQLAQADYDACKEMEKAGVKNLTPQYTGQG